MLAADSKIMYWTKCIHPPITGILSAVEFTNIYKCKFHGFELLYTT
jgi:hypothetical protein